MKWYTRRMEVVLIAAITLDGFIARSKHESSLEWTSKEDTKWFVQKTKEIGYCIMGKTTFDTIGRPLPERQIFVLSSAGESVDSQKIGEKNSVMLTNAPPRELLAALEEKGISSVAICGGSSIYSQFLATGLVTRLFLTVEPVLFGRGIPLIADPVDIRLKQESEFPLSSTAFVREYRVVSANLGGTL